MKHFLIYIILSYVTVMNGNQDIGGSPATGSGNPSPKITVGGFRFGTYTITPLDRIQVSIFGEPELMLNEIVDRHGMVYLRLIGEISVSQLTVKQAEEKIELEYINKRYLRRPKARIRIVDYAPQEVLMLGEVRNPGPFSFPHEVEAMDIVEAVARSGGTTVMASEKKVTVKRKTDAGFDVYRVDLKSLKRGLEEGNDEGRFFLRPGDIVFVPERII
jgi:polysaccharide export outer membrane protein